MGRKDILEPVGILDRDICSTKWTVGNGLFLRITISPPNKENDPIFIPSKKIRLFAKHFLQTVTTSFHLLIEFIIADSDVKQKSSKTPLKNP